MIGLDTNVLVRYIVQDDAKQSSQASAIVATLTRETPGFISTVTLIELVWVMQSCYSVSKAEIIAMLDMLLRTHELVVENAETVIKALYAFVRAKADFSDCLIERSGHKAGCQYTVTFDVNAAKTVGMQLASELR